MRSSLKRWVPVVGLAMAVAAVTPGAARAQYFGQNKVQYRTFQFKIIETEHFDVYYYDAERAAALDAARMAERAYARLSRILHHQFQGRKPIILYASHSEFQQTNALGPDDISEGVEGVTEFYKHRMVVPFTGDYAAFEHVLQHEMVHQFQYDVFSHGRIGGGMQTLANVNPPGWFMEGMAEYLSIGPLDPHTTMWMRDAALEGNLPTIEQMTYDPNVFPYRFGHALWAYVGEKWGDEAIGEILQSSVSLGIEGAFKRATGLTLDELSADWRDAIQATFLPELGQHYKARRIAQPLLTEKRSDGSLHLAPALSPDGRDIAYFSERNSFFVDLYLADAETGKVKRRLVKSSLSNNYESLRFIYSAGSWSPDGKAFAIAAKHKDRDDLVLLDVARDKEERRIVIPLNGLTTPSWSPDGQQLVFTGYDGGISDLFIVNRDGSGFRRLTNDKDADLDPSWSPDGKTIAFATDRGPETDFSELKFGNLRIALYHLDTGEIEVLTHMDYGKNINPVWAPDGKSLAFVSDRTGISNIFLFDLGDRNVYQLTDVFTGVSGITPISPVLSWAHEADRLAFSYYENGEYDVYAVDNPRSLKRAPYQETGPLPVVSLLPSVHHDSAAAQVATSTPAAPQPGEAASVYRAPSGFRASGGQPLPAETTAVQAPVSVRTLLDSTSLALPDTTEFTFRPYHVHFTADYVARPTVGYERDNFGRGFFGGTAISLSDMLGDHTLVFSGSVNGRLSEAQVLSVYVNQAHRLNWAAGFTQDPYYFYAAQSAGPCPAAECNDSTIVKEITSIERLVVRDAFAEGYYPFSRFTRVELGVHAVNVSAAVLNINDYFAPDAFGGYQLVQEGSDERNLASIGYLQPSVGYTHDNALFGYVGPFSGARSHFEVAPSFGGWRFTAATADWRRYFFARPFTLAVRGLFFGRFGRDANLFPSFLGSTELIRGYTAGSIENHECQSGLTDSTGYTGCAMLDRLIGSRVAVANVELRFPLTRSFVLGFLPIGLPPIEGALFYDAGVAWNGGDQLKLSYSPTNSIGVRSPLKSYGTSIRVNMLGWVILRFDYTKPINRPHNNAYWTISLGPTF
ncbi:MAG TPA: BamA/TamA family outer membrane protein [Gemmatimonadales bacterium]|nr:BamA/TamA family outer membrane protein [Gemmatimonadales bacterium]